jgi:hypothetical protein
LSSATQDQIAEKLCKLLREWWQLKT